MVNLSKRAFGLGLKKHKPARGDKRRRLTPSPSSDPSGEDKKVTSLYFTLLDIQKQRLHVYKIDVPDTKANKLQLLFVSKRCQSFTLVSLGTQIFCLGGIWYWTDDVHYNSTGSTDVFSFDTSIISDVPMEDRGWVARSSMNFPRLRPRAVVLQNRIVVMAGIDDSQHLTSKYWAEIFVPETNSWHNLSVAGSGDLSLYSSIMESIPSHLLEEYERNRDPWVELHPAFNIAVYSATKILIVVSLWGVSATTFLFDINTLTLTIKDVLAERMECLDPYHPDQPVRVGDSIYHLLWADFDMNAYNINQDKYFELPPGKAFASQHDLLPSDSMGYRNCCTLRIDDGIALSSDGPHELHILWFPESNSGFPKLYYKTVRVFQDGNFLNLFDTTPNVYRVKFQSRLLEGCCLTGSVRR